MEIAAEQRINASRKEVFAALNNPDILRQCIPGCESLDKTSDTEMAAVVALKVGPVQARFKGGVTLSNIVPSESYTITGEGSGGAAGFAKGAADIVLVEDGSGTILKYTVKADVGGRIAQLGARLIDSVAKNLSGKFFAKFCELTETGAAPSVTKTSAPAQAAGSSRTVWVIAAAVIIAGFAVYFLWR